MLVLSRKANEKIRIGDDITITILRLKGKTVRVGVEAPGAVPVLRGELSFEQPDDRAPRSSVENAAEHNAAKRTRKPATPKVEGASSDDWPRDANRCVSHARVPRSRVATVLPQMLGDAGPLRAMLDRRAAAGEF